MEEDKLNLSKRERILLGVLLFVGIFSLYFFCLFWPKCKEFQDYRQILAERRVEFNQIKLVYNEEELSKVDQEWLKVKNQIPSSMKLPDLYMNLLDLRRRSGVSYDFIEFTSLEKASQEVYEDGAMLSKVNINVMLIGNYEQVDSFLKSLYDNERRLEVTKIYYENKEGKIHATIELAALAFLKEEDEEWTQYDFVQGKSYGKSNPYFQEKIKSTDNSTKISNTKDKP